MIENVVIKYDTGYMTLRLPAFFNSSSLTGIRKLFKILKEYAYLNSSVLETLDCFFFEYQQDLERQLEEAMQEKKNKEQALRLTESEVACFGTMMTKEMKAELNKVQRETKTADTAVKRTKSALERCGKIKNAYNTILR